MTASAWIEIGWRACQKSYSDRLTMLAAGVAFFVVLAVFPGIAAMVSLYSFFADPEKGDNVLAVLPTVLPDQAVEIITRQTRRIADQNDQPSRALIFAPWIGFAIVLVSATKGIRSLLAALNLIHHIEERRGYLKLTIISLVFTTGFIIFLLLVVGVIFVLPAVLDAIGLGGPASRILSLLRWPILFVVVGLSLALIYRFGSSRENIGWRWISLGSGAASLLWILLSLLFEWVTSRFGGFDALYGSLSTIIGFMVWIWLSTIVVLFGAEVAAVAERNADPSSRSPAPSLDHPRALRL